MQINDALRELLDNPAVSGDEKKAAEVIAAMFEKYSENVEIDRVGNVIAKLGNPYGKKLLLCAHMDEVGFVVSGIEDNGIVRATAVGGVFCPMYQGRNVAIRHDGSYVRGSVLYYDDSQIEKGRVDYIRIDIGARTKQEAMQQIRTGDSVMDTEMQHVLNDKYLTGRALDNNVGVYIIYSVLEQLSKLDIDMEIHFVANSGEETAKKGIRWLLKHYDYDEAVVVDGIPLVDMYKDNKGYSVGMGCGPVLCGSAMVPRDLNRQFEELSVNHGIHVQYEYTNGRTKSDYDIVWENGIYSTILSYPINYMHSPCEVVDMDDIQQCIELLTLWVKEMAIKVN